MLFEMVDENILLLNSVLRQSVVLVIKDASNITQSDLQYTVMSEEVDGVGDKRSRIITDTLGGLFCHLPELCLFHQ
jgi:hypothetical protein